MGSRFFLRLMGAGIVVLSSLALVGSAGAAPRQDVARTSATAFHPRVGRAWGLVPALGRAGLPGQTVQPLLYHGGTVMRDVEIHTVFWAPSGYAFPGAPASGAPGYTSLLQKFFTDGANASTAPGNLFSVLDEYGDGTGAGASTLRYSAAADSVDDTTAFPGVKAQCTSATGLRTCLTVPQVEAELDRVVQGQSPSARGLHNLWVLMLPPDVDVCLQAGPCGSNGFAGYHSLFDRGHGETIYALIVNPLIEGVPPAGADPEGNPVAEQAIDVAAHETVEAVSDPEGTGWIDSSGGEVGDKCELSDGGFLGYANGAPYNQLLSGDPYLVQTMWSNPALACVGASAAGPAPSLPGLALRQFSAVVRGSTGLAHGGVRVTVALVRNGTTVAKATTQTTSRGAWSAVLRSPRTGAPVPVGDDRDEIDINYGHGGPPSEVIDTGSGGDPLGQAGFTGWSTLDSGFAVGRHSVSISPCSQVGVLAVTVAGAGAPSPVDHCSTDTDTSTVATGPIGPNTVVTLSSSDNRAVGNHDPQGALVRLTIPLGEPGSVSATGGGPSSQLSKAGFPVSAGLSNPTGLPTCTADLSRQLVVCSGLVAHDHYALAGGAARRTARADEVGMATFSDLGRAAWFRGGDRLTLRNRAGRILTRLHVAHMRVALGASGDVVGGRCEPGEYWGPATTQPGSTLPLLLLLLGTTETFGGSTVCPLGGHSAGLPGAPFAQSDSFSGGSTTIEVPRFTTTSPANGATLYGSFIAMAQLTHLRTVKGHHPPTPSVTVRITRRGAHRPIVTLTGVNSPQGVRVPSLAPGIYDAKWTLTDANGDSRTLQSYFVREP